jgi:Reverse transcriptase (RNA-dependent DNA polymerase)
VLAQPNDIEPEKDYQHPAIAFAASNNPDIMYWHKAMRQSDRKQFIQAAKEEIDGQTQNGNWRIIPKSSVPEGATILPAVWAMRRKRRISTGEIYRWKARLNLDGSKQIKGIHYWETYAPVASWPTIRLILTMAIIKRWHTKQIDFVQAYTQAKIETDNVYMKIPKGFEIRGKNTDECVLKIDQNIYGGKAAGRVWNKHLVNKLTEIGFKQSEIDHCLFYRGQAVYVLYTDDSILAGPDEAELDQIVEDMKRVGLKLSVDGDVSDFLGVKINHEPDGTIHLTQPQIIDSILKDLHLLSDNVKTRQTPAAVTTILRRHPNSETFDEHFNYRSVIGKLNFLEKSTRPDISCATHQCARFASNPKKEHGKAVEWLCRYLASTRDKGIILKPTEQSFDVYVDADYVGNWDPETASNDIDTARSRTGYVVFYAGCPIIWKSKLQTQIALSTTEAEFMALSAALRETIPLMELVKELQRYGYDFTAVRPTVHCRVFEDNSGAIELARVPKMRPRTKFINVQYHHFRQYVDRKEISILSIDTTDQCADILTKSVSLSALTKLRFRIMGW